MAVEALVADDVTVGTAVAIAVADDVAVGTAVATRVADGVAVGTRVADDVAVGMAVEALVADDVAVGTTVAIAVADDVAVGMAVPVAVTVGVSVAVAVAAGVGVSVGAEEGNALRLTISTCPDAHETAQSTRAPATVKEIAADAGTGVVLGSQLALPGTSNANQDCSTAGVTVVSVTVVIATGTPSTQATTWLPTRASVPATCARP